MAESFHLRVLGPVTLQAEGDAQASSRITQPRLLALLSYLALARPRGLHSRDTIISLLWPDASEQQGRRALRNALYAIRGALGGRAVASVGDNLIGLDEGVLSCDAWRLERGELTDVSVGATIEPLSGLHIDGARDLEEWLERERRRLKGLLELPNTVRTEAGGSANVAHPAGGRRRILHSPDPESMYARGHYLFLRAAHGGPPEELLRCGKYFERARALDPSFAPAVAGLANFYAVAARRGVLPDFHETFGRAIQLSEEATRMDPTLAIPHVHFGVKALYLDDDWDLAGREFSVAVMLEPDYVEARRFHGIWLGLVDRPRDALRQMEAAAALEPDYPLILSSLAAARVAVGDLAGGEVALRETLRLAPTHGAARERLVRLLEDSGRFEEAVAERRRSATAAGADAFLTGWARAGAEGYRRALRESLLGEAERLEASLLEKRAPAPNDIFAPPILRLGAVYARLGDWKRVRECRLRAMAERPGMARWFDTAEMRPAAQSKTQAFE